MDSDHDSEVQMLPLYIAFRACDPPDHYHCFFGVMSDLSPLPGQAAYMHESGEFFYPFTEYIQCLN